MRILTTAALALSALGASAPAYAAVYRLDLQGTVSDVKSYVYQRPGSTGLSDYLSGFKANDPISLAFTYNPTGVKGYPERWTTNLVYPYVKITDIDSSFTYANVDPFSYVVVAEIGIGLEPRGGGGEGDSFDVDAFSLTVDGGYNQDSRFSMRFGGADRTGTALTSNAFDQVIPLARFPGVGASFQFGDDSGSIQFEVANLRATIAAVPEPNTWAMMILGFGVVGYAMRRRTVLRFV